MTITRQMLDTDLQSWFLNAKNAEHAKEEILAVFSEEPGDGYTWSEQVLPPSVIVGKQTALCVGGSRGYLAQAE